MKDQKMLPTFKPVKSAVRVFDILEELLEDEKGFTVHELGKRLGIASSSIHALVHTMLERQYLYMDPSRKLKLGIKFLDYFNSLSFNPLISLSKPTMKEMAKMLNENVHLAVLEGIHSVFIAYEQTTHPVRYYIEVGQSLLAHLTGVGKMLLSQFPNEKIISMYKNVEFEKVTGNSIGSIDELLERLKIIRAQGYSIDDGESLQGAKCFAAPIYNGRNEMIASISISVPFVRSEGAPVKRMIELITEAARRISDNFMSHE